MNCELVDQRDLDSRYVAGTLNEEDAEAFESHFFGCERCWGLVQQGLAVQAAHEGAAPAAQRPSSTPLPGSRSSARPSLRPRPWWGLAAAAILVVAVVGIRRFDPGAERSGSDDVFRGEAETLVLSPGADRTSVAAAWPKVSEADVYQVRLYAADGTLVAERELGDTTIVLIRDSLPIQRGELAFWEVQALDRLRNPIARSELTRAVLPDSTR
jgi:anti-sigma factor RsiW